MQQTYKEVRNFLRNRREIKAEEFNRHAKVVSGLKAGLNHLVSQGQVVIETDPNLQNTPKIIRWVGP